VTSRSSGVAASMAISDTSAPRAPASSAAAVRTRVTDGCSPSGSPSSTSRSNGPSSASSSCSPASANSSNASSPKSSAAGNSGSGDGTNGPSRVATWSYPAAGSAPNTAGYFAFAASWEANRRAAATATGDPPQISGSAPARSSASDFAGLTNESLDGRHWCEMSSMAAAAASYASSSSCARPILEAITSSGMVSAHGMDLAGPPESTGMNVPRARCASSCSGEPGAPTPTNSQPRRVASAASASGSAVSPDRDAAITRSAAPTQPGS
jgi:hypothetical protein